MVDEAMGENQSKLEAAFDSMNDGLAIVNSDGHIINVNDAFAHFHRFSNRDEYFKFVSEYENVFEIYTLDGKFLPIEDWPVNRGLRGEINSDFVVLIKRTDTGESWYGSYSYTPVHYKDGIIVGSVVTMRDITERIKEEEKVKTSLKEKEVLLKEVNHRVKNHLQIINSILSLQSVYIKDKDDLAIFQETQNSIRSMALIHEKIYASGNLSEINLTEYLQVLASHLIKSFAISSRVHLNFDMDQVFLPVEKAVPCGLIVNELITNSMKYAFPDNRAGEISVILRLSDQLTMTVKDNGVGFPENIDYKNADSFGMQIISSLMEQLDGSFKLESGAGTTFHIFIPV